jgi:DNA repair protein RadD
MKKPETAKPSSSARPSNTPRTWRAVSTPGHSHRIRPWPDVGYRTQCRSYGIHEGEAQVIVNVAVLTEGWDHPPTSCVVLLRPSSYKSTMIQMIGRGLRTVDPAEHPDIIKKDCIVLDFGTSTLLHGSLEQDVNLDDQIGEGDAPFKECPECGAEVPAAVKECPLCGYEWKAQAAARELAENGFVMAEIDLLKRSSFLWVDLQQNDRYFLATGFNAWGGVFFKDGEWHAVGGKKNHAPKLLAVGRTYRLLCCSR